MVSHCSLDSPIFDDECFLIDLLSGQVFFLRNVYVGLGPFSNQAYYRVELLVYLAAHHSPDVQSAGTFADSVGCIFIPLIVSLAVSKTLSSSNLTYNSFLLWWPVLWDLD